MPPDAAGASLVARARDALLAERTPAGHWEGRLSSSALSTATAVAALALHAKVAASAPAGDRGLAAAGIRWLVAHRNADGGWGDTVDSPSNISTTVLAWAALGVADQADDAAQAAARDAEAWIRTAAGGLDARSLSAAVGARYGRDRTFSVPILTMCALAGRFGEGPAAWARIPALPFELAAAPRALFGFLRLPVVSYALPALIAMGLVRHRRRPTRNPIAWLLRQSATSRVLRVLDALQPTNGGFLEATPLTSFVAMSLVGAGEHAHPVVARALAFVRASVRRDGSWPIDTHLATWVTTLAWNALHAAGAAGSLSDAERRRLARWLVEQQHVREHVYTGARPGGWAWTPLPGGVPDADDTAGAVLALATLPAGAEAERAARDGIAWLLALQNRDGGIPTFCRGWGALPFDRSGADLTAHAVRAWDAWLDRLDDGMQANVARAIDRALLYLRRAQREDGSFLPLWFGNQSAPEEASPTYGTARVLSALTRVACRDRSRVDAIIRGAAAWLVASRNRDGGWGGDRGAPSSIEETALAVGALAEATRLLDDDRLRTAVTEGCAWLERGTEDGTRFPAVPIGLYFAKLWYSEKLYPVVFALEGAGRAGEVARAAEAG